MEYERVSVDSHQELCLKCSSSDSNKISHRTVELCRVESCRFLPFYCCCLGAEFTWREVNVMPRLCQEKYKLQRNKLRDHVHRRHLGSV